jgi:diguanylate cyclase (GGDEF)-like protein
MRFPQIIRALSLVRPLGLAGALFSLLILAGYVLDIEVLFRPLHGDPATHPLSAVALAVLGLGAFFWHPRRANRLVLFAGCLVVLLASLRLLELATGAALLNWLTPFSSRLAVQAAAGHPIATGSNTALMSLCFGLSLVAVGFKRYALAQPFAFFGVGFPLVSITGYAYGIDDFYGQMAMTTALGGIMVGMAILLSGAHRSFLRSILSPWVGGKVARVQILLGYIVPFLIGYFLALTIANNPVQQFGLFCVLISAFISILVGFTAVIQEEIDCSRRRAERRLVLFATLDSLTELPNRRRFYEHGQWLLERVRRTGESLTVLMFDIDFFKRINDTYGHATGDAVLQQLAITARHILRGQDLMARYGGEEFVIIMPTTGLAGALLLGEKLRAHIAATDFAGANRITISLGCAEYLADENLHDLVARADAALYRAKRGGRNRVVAAEAVRMVAEIQNCQAA